MFKLFSNSGKFLILLFLGFYRSVGTTHLGGACRFHPSCSEYAVEAVHRFHIGRAIILIIKRLLKCRPGGPFGLDPLPSHGENKNAE